MKKDRLLNEDCIKGMASCRRSVDLAFADPPFNIGYDYDVTTTPRDRRLPRLVAAVIEGVVRVLKPDGTFWLAIGDSTRRSSRCFARASWGCTAEAG